MKWMPTIVKGKYAQRSWVKDRLGLMALVWPADPLHHGKTGNAGGGTSGAGGSDVGGAAAGAGLGTSAGCGAPSYP